MSYFSLQVIFLFLACGGQRATGIDECGASQIERRSTDRSGSNRRQGVRRFLPRAIPPRFTFICITITFPDVRRI